MPKPDATTKPRRSARIQEIVARQKVQAVQRAAKLETESMMPEQPTKRSKPMPSPKRKRPGETLPPTGSGFVAKTEAGTEGEIKLSAVPSKKQKTNPQPDKASVEFQDTPADKEEQVATPLIEKQAMFKQVVVSGDRDTIPQQDEATAELPDMSADREERRVITSLVVEQASVDEDCKTTPHEDEAIAELPEISADKAEQATTPIIEEQALADEGQQFLKILSSIILADRQLRRKIAARRKCLDEQDKLDWLLNFRQSSLANVPPEETFPGVRDKKLADVQSCERNLKQRREQEADLDNDISVLRDTLEVRKRRIGDFMNAELPPDSLPPSLKNNADFRKSYKYCRSLAQTVKDIEVKLNEAERERETAFDSYYDQASRALFKEAARTDARLDFNEVDSHNQALRDNSELHAKHLVLEHDLWRTKTMCSAQKGVLAKLAERDLDKHGRLQPEIPDGDKAEPKPEEVGQPKTPEQATGEPSEAERLKAEREAVKAELMSAQAHLCTAYKEFQGCRYLTEEEFAQLPKSTTEDDVGLHLQMKLIRTTRNYIEAQERVKTAQAEGRRLGVPGVDKYPTDQTYDFEDRTDDGYADSIFADKVKWSKPRVEKWLSRIAVPGEALPSPTKPEVSKRLLELAELRLGDDKAEDFSSAGAKERIARYQKACEDLRNNGHFPSAVPDRFILRERLSELGSHMI